MTAEMIDAGLTPRKLAAFRGMVEAHCGLVIPSTQDGYLAERIARRMEETGCHCVDDYLFFLFERSDEELHELINLLTINETYFFRHLEQFELLRLWAVRRIVTHPGKPLVVWDAACSIGCEPYSVAMALKEICDEHKLELRVMATDIDDTVLALARQGLYSRRAVTAEMPEMYLQRHFRLEPDGQYRISDEIKSKVFFRKHNLKHDIYPRNVDVILCRNVLIYFNEADRWKVIRNLHDAMSDEDAALFLSPVESVPDLRIYFAETVSPSGLKCYRKWSTDRRDDRPVSPKNLNQRRPLESYPFPSVECRGEVIVVNGIIAGRERVTLAANALSFVLGQACGTRDAVCSIDLTGVPYITNAGIEMLAARVRAVPRTSCRLKRIIVGTDDLREHLVRAGLQALCPIVEESPSATEPAAAMKLDAAPPGAGVMPVRPPGAGVMPEKNPPPPVTHAAPVRPPTARPAAEKPAPPAATPHRAPDAGQPPPAVTRRISTPPPVAVVESAIEGADCLLAFENRLYAAAREFAGRAPDARAPLVIDLRPVQYADKEFFVLLQKFLTLKKDTLDVRIMCSDFMRLWMLKFSIPDKHLRVSA